jgi:FkbM family methyltransferase
MQIPNRSSLNNIKRTFLTYLKLRSLDVSVGEIYRLVCNENIESTVLFNKKLGINSSFWYLHGLNELFIDQTYRFNSEKNDPRIIDCGANIGLSVIYFKSIFLKAKIIAFEPDPNIFKILSDNLKNFDINDVEIINKAVWNKNGDVSFNASGGVGGRIDDEVEVSKETPAIRLKDLLNEKIDFLKIDIEGAEYEVVRDCADYLSNVENIFIEYHSMLRNEQKLDEILLILKRAGFKYYIKEAWNNQPFPYTNARGNLFDLQLNIFGYRIK